MCVEYIPPIKTCQVNDHLLPGYWPVGGVPPTATGPGARTYGSALRIALGIQIRNAREHSAEAAAEISKKKILAAPERHIGTIRENAIQIKSNSSK